MTEFGRRGFLGGVTALGCTAAASPLITPVTFAATPGEARLVVIVLRGAMDRHIVIIGSEKRDAIERAQHLSPDDAPVAAILKGTTVHWAEA
jgi:uncharacterized protein (DUF1501 family)